MKRVLGFLGLVKPYDFEGALPSLVGSILVGMTIALGGALAFTGRLHWGSPRAIFFIYLVLIGTLIVLARRRRKCAIVLIGLLTLEIVLAVVPAVTKRVVGGDPAATLMPPD